MAHYVILANFTEQGIREIQNTGKRAKAFRHVAKERGVTIKDIYWTLGRHDGVLVIEAPDDETAAAVLLLLGSNGNVRVETLRAFDWAEFQTVLDHIS